MSVAYGFVVRQDKEVKVKCVIYLRSAVETPLIECRNGAKQSNVNDADVQPLVLTSGFLKVIQNHKHEIPVRVELLSYGF